MSAEPLRRSIVAALAAAALSPLPASAAPRGLWEGYARRLGQRLVDAGGGAFDPGMERAMADLNNRFRAEQGRAALRWNDELCACARAHAADMAQRSFFDHRTTERFDVGDRAAILARTLLGAPGENIAYRFDPRRPPTAGEFMRGWRDSPGHRENMLKASYTHVGYGVARNGQYVRAVGVFAAVHAQLPSALPWRPAGRADIERLLAGASPPLGRYGLSEPGVDQAYDIVALGRPGRALPPDVSQLRPLIASRDGGYDVLWGPVFVV